MNSIFNLIFLASQNIVIYRNNVSEVISPLNLNSNLNINLLLMIVLVAYTILIVVFYRRLHQNHLNSQILVQNLQQRVNVLEIKFIDTNG